MHTMAYNGSQVNIAEICRNWQSWVSARFLLYLPKLAVMGFRAFLVMDNTVARQEMAENGRQWQKMVENGRKKFTAVIW